MHSGEHTPHDSDVMDTSHHFSSSTDHTPATTEEDTKLLANALGSFPSHAVKDLLSNGVCIGCVFRIFGMRGNAYFCRNLASSEINDIIGEQTRVDNHITSSNGVEDVAASMELEELCPVCLGILQFAYRDEKELVCRKLSGSDFALMIAELVKKEGHVIDSFSLEVSIPPIIQENENVVWSYLNKKYDSEICFQGSVSERTSTKDALKLAISSPLETFLDVKSSPSSFRIRLTYTHVKASRSTPIYVDSTEVSKRRKVDACAESLDVSMAKENAVSATSSNGSEVSKSSKFLDFPFEKVKEPCLLVFSCSRAPIYIGGRYLKFSRNVSQTRWMIDDERMGEASVEEIIGGNILPMFQGDIYKFHAAGREDIDVRMLGSGRPFLVEIQNAHQIPSEASVKQIETNINNLENKLVGVKNLKVVTNNGWNLMHEGESEKQKQYCALVWISRPLEDDDLHMIASLKNMNISQRTPVRVLHRRSPLERDKTIHWMKIERIAGSSQYFLLHLCTQAGTYIKEFVHGDLGRTHPSIGSILNCRAEILRLDVTDVIMDCFLKE